MTYDIQDGWIEGRLPGPGGQMYEVEKVPRSDQSYLRLAVEPSNLVLHTTEGGSLGSAYRSWPYPPQFGVGDHRIVQLFPLWAQGKASRGQDPWAMQIEIVGFSKTSVWLPGPESLHPLVALVAVLHQERLIRTGLERPTEEWPVHVDRLPAATTSYYRRHAGLWPDVAGVYGHIELFGDAHWDPGGFDYPRFFEMVREVLEGDEDMRLDDIIKGHQAYRKKFKELGRDPGNPPKAKPDDFKEGWRQARFAATNPRDAAS